MSTPLQDLDARLDEVGATLDFVSLAGTLRPRVSTVLDWKSSGEVMELTRRFIDTKFARLETVFGSLLVYTVAALERFLRAKIAEILNQRVRTVRRFGELPEGLQRRHMSLTGRMLASVDSPRDHLTISPDALIENLATCKQEASSFRLNLEVFQALITGTGPSVVDRALEAVEGSDCWDSVGRSAGMSTHLGTKKTRETANRARERLNEITRWRNQIAHAGDQELRISENQLREAVSFVRLLAQALDSAIK